MVNLIADKSVDITTLGKSSIGSNISSIGYTNAPVFVDWMKAGTLWKSDAMTAENMLLNGHMNRAGQILSIPTGTGKFETTIRKWYGVPEEGIYSGRWTLRWEGPNQGVKFRVINGAALTNYDDTSVANEIQFDMDCTFATNCYVEINAALFDPANPQKNFTLVENQHKAWHTAGNVGHPKFLLEVQKYGILRLMDLALANDNYTSLWSQRALPTDQFYRSRTVLTKYLGNDTATCATEAPWEVQFKLIKECNAYGWFNLPARSDENYWIEWAKLAAASPIGRGIGVAALGNEHWNFSFKHFSYLRQLSLERWGVESHYDMQCRRVTLMGLAIRSIIPEKERIEITAEGWQLATNRTVQMITAPLWLQKEPDAYVEPKTVIDNFAIGGYYYVIDLDTKLDAVYNAWQASTAAGTPTAFLNYMVPQADAGGARTEEQFADHTAILAPYGIKLVVYEGVNQHITAQQFKNDLRFYPNGRSGDPHPEFLALLKALYLSQGIADVTDRMRTSAKNAGIRWNCLFANNGFAGKFGGWGITEFYGQTNPNTIKIAQWIDNNPRDFLLGVSRR